MLRWRPAGRGVELSFTVVSWSHIWLAGLWGGLLSLERRAFLQAMFSRPLAAATGAGLLLDDVHGGVYVGLVFELFYLGRASLGGAHPDHETLPAVAAATIAASLADAADGPSTPTMWSIGILLAAPLGPIGRVLESALDRRAARYLGAALSSADLGNFARVSRQNLWGMWPHLVIFGAICSVYTVLGYRISALEQHLPLNLARGLAWAYPAMASVAAALAVRGSRSLSAVRWAGAAAAVTLAVAAMVALSEAHW